MPCSSASSQSSNTTAVPEEMKQQGQPYGRAFSLSAIMGDIISLSVEWGLLPVLYLYKLYQYVVSVLFTAAYHPRPPNFKPYGRIAIIGAGLTGISSAAHAVAHGFDVVIYEAEEEVGGVWARVNSTSSLQLNSILYRFHPSITWSRGFPHRDEIVGQIKALWHRYHLEASTRLNTPVTEISRDPKLSTEPRQGGHGRWIINDGEDGIFDAVIVSIGTCGAPKMASIPGLDSFINSGGVVLHSSQLDNAELEGRKVVIVGSGASGVEAAELCVEKNAKGIVIMARDDKWIIPRNTVFDILLALQPFGREMPLSFIPEWIVRKFHYRDQADLSPVFKGLFQGTPIVNDEFLQHIRQGLITYKRGDTIEVTSQGVKINERPRQSKSGDQGIESIQTADVIILATGFVRPSVGILPPDLFPENYKRPNLYLQNFSTEDWSVLLTNASYMDAIGTVGNWHIGLYSRVLLVFLLDKNARPSPKGMKLWVDLINWVKVKSFGNIEKASGLAFFTYAELCIYLITFHLFNIWRLPWLFFVLFGWGVKPDSKKPKRKVRIQG